MGIKELESSQGMKVGRNLSKQIADKLLNGEDDLSQTIVDESIRLWKEGATQKQLGKLFGQVFAQGYNVKPKTLEMVIQRIIKARLPEEERREISFPRQHWEGHEDLGRNLGLSNTPTELSQRGAKSAQKRGQELFPEEHKRLVFEIAQDPQYVIRRSGTGKSIGKHDWDKITVAFNDQAGVKETKERVRAGFFNLKFRKHKDLNEG